VIVGTQQSRAEKWHHALELTETRRWLDRMADGPTEAGWHEVVAEGRAKSKSRTTAKARD
jgi:hypothetical protein